jgi:hypothetical protein
MERDARPCLSCIIFIILLKSRYVSGIPGSTNAATSIPGKRAPVTHLIGSSGPN